MPEIGRHVRLALDWLVRADPTLEIQREQADRAAVAWQGEAERRGMEFSRTGRAGAQFRLAAEIEGILLAFDFQWSHRQDLRSICASGTVAAEARALHIRVSEHSLLSFFDRPTLRTGHDDFDVAFGCWSKTREEARAFLDDELRAALLAFPQAARFRGFTFDGRGASLWWKDTELAPTHLDAATRVILAACRRREVGAYR